MANSVSLTDGTTTVSLSSAPCILMNFNPEGPDWRNGVPQPVTESIEFAIKSTTTALVRAKLREVENLLYQAQYRSRTRTGPKIYLMFQATDDAEAQRSEVLSYSITLGKDTAFSFSQFLLEVRLVLTRMPFWEGARTQIPLSNGNGTNNTAGLTVRNCNDGTAGDDNYMDIAVDVIAGSLPAPLEIRFANASGASRWYYNWHIANNIYGTGFTHIIEGETSLAGYGTSAVDAAMSNGNYITQTGAGWLYFRWTIPSAQLGYLAGRYVRVLASFRSLSSSDRTAQISLLDFAGLGTSAEAPMVILKAGDDFIQDLGILPIPAVPYGGQWSDHKLQLGVKTPSSEAVQVDFIQLTPAEPMLYRKLQQRGFQMVVGDAVVDDGIEGLTYYEDGTTFVRYPIYIPFLNPVHVWPDIAQRLLLLHDGLGQVPAWAVTAKAWYRPRRTLL